MFSYTHFLGGFSVELKNTFSYTVTPITDSNGGVVVPGTGGSSSTLNFTRVKTLGEYFVSEVGENSTGFNEAINVTYITSYPYGTQSASSVLVTSTRSGSLSQTNPLADQTSTSINLANQEPIAGNAYSTEPYSGMTNGTRSFDGLSSVIGSCTFTRYDTKTQTSSIMWLQNSELGITLSGSAQQTIANTSSSITETLQDVPTLTYLFGQLVGVEAWYNERRNPPPLREVAGLLQIPSFQSGYCSFKTTSQTGSVITLTTAISSSAYSRRITTSTSFAGDTDGGDETNRGTFQSSYTGFKITSFSTTGLALDIDAQRLKFSGDHYFHTNMAGVAGTSFELSPEISFPEDFFVSFGVNALVPSIYTTPKSGATINSSSATLLWTYSNSSWILTATLQDSSTTANTSILINITGDSSTISDVANDIIGCSTAILAPFFLNSDFSMNNISVTISNNLPTSESVDGFFGFSGRSFAPSSSSSKFSTSFSSGSSFSSSYTYSELTNLSHRSFYANQYGASVSQETLVWPDSTAQVVANPLFVEGHGAYFQSKWNEAGRQDPVPYL